MYGIHIRVKRGGPYIYILSSLLTSKPAKTHSSYLQNGRSRPCITWRDSHIEQTSFGYISFLSASRFDTRRHDYTCNIFSYNSFWSARWCGGSCAFCWRCRATDGAISLKLLFMIFKSIAHIVSEWGTSKQDRGATQRDVDEDWDHRDTGCVMQMCNPCKTIARRHHIMAAHIYSVWRLGIIKCRRAI